MKVSSKQGEVKKLYASLISALTRLFQRLEGCISLPEPRYSAHHVPRLARGLTKIHAKEPLRHMPRPALRCTWSTRWSD